MPRLPVTGRPFAAALLAGFCLAVNAHAADRPLPSAKTILPHLQKSPLVQLPAAEFRAASQVSMFYHLCGTELGYGDDRQKYAGELYARSWKQYEDAFAQAHVALTGKQPPAATITAYRDLMKKEGSDAALAVDAQIRKDAQGCKRPSLQKLDRYAQKMQAHPDAPVGPRVKQKKD